MQIYEGILILQKARNQENIAAFLWFSFPSKSFPTTSIYFALHFYWLSGSSTLFFSEAPSSQPAIDLKKTVDIFPSVMSVQ